MIFEPNGQIQGTNERIKEMFDFDNIDVGTLKHKTFKFS